MKGRESSPGRAARDGAASRRMSAKLELGRFLLLVACVMIGGSADLLAQGRGSEVVARRAMVDEAVVGAGVSDARVIHAMLVTPRHEFVPPAQRSRAYYDMALPIGGQQTISSPFIVAYMTQCLDPRTTDRVLEIGTGSGYQAAVLSHLVKEVYSIEIVESLGRRAEQTLRRLKYDNVMTKVGDGFLGWPEHAPFDKIIVTCSPEEVPRPLVEQLREGGLMVIPTGERYQQTLYLMRKVNGALESEALRPTLFVPMTGAAEDSRKTLPDPGSTAVVNGGFEEPPAENGFIAGWYYQRQLEWVSAEDAPEGQHYVTFRNETPGRASHLLQGIPIDGRLIARVDLSASVRHESIRFANEGRSFPMLSLTLYDQNRREVGHHWIGPFRDNSRWRAVRKSFHIPDVSREAILRIGLFGATGEISFDNIVVESHPR